jgi:hypothetical protein
MTGIDSLDLSAHSGSPWSCCRLTGRDAVVKAGYGGARVKPDGPRTLDILFRGDVIVDRATALGRVLPHLGLVALDGLMSIRFRMTRGKSRH